MPSIPTAREPVQWTVEVVIKSIYPRGKAPDPNGISTSQLKPNEMIPLIIGIPLFFLFILCFIWILMYTGKEMNNLGETVAGKMNGSGSSITVPAPAKLKPDKDKSVSNLSPSSSIRNSMSESDQYWLWWSRKTNGVADEEAAIGPRDSPRETHS